MRQQPTAEAVETWIRGRSGKTRKPSSWHALVSIRPDQELWNVVVRCGWRRYFDEFEVRTDEPSERCGNCIAELRRMRDRG